MKYSVWVGGVSNNFTNYKDAFKDYKYWLSKGYKDVIITINKDKESIKWEDITVEI